jgi:hypothetical protein
VARLLPLLPPPPPPRTTPLLRMIVSNGDSTPVSAAAKPQDAAKPCAPGTLLIASERMRLALLMLPRARSLLALAGAAPGGVPLRPPHTPQALPALPLSQPSAAMACTMLQALLPLPPPTLQLLLPAPSELPGPLASQGWLMAYA